VQLRGVGRVRRFCQFVLARGSQVELGTATSTAVDETLD
jgi:hypothetical protein